MDIRSFISRAFRTAFKDTWLYRWRVWSITRNEAAEVMTRYMDVESMSVQQRKEILSQMKKALILDGWQYYEFFMFHYRDISKAQRKEFVTEFEKDNWTRKVNGEEVNRLFKDKWETYKQFAKFYKRDVIRVLSEKDKVEFDAFVSNHLEFIIKPIDGSLGQGIQKCKASDFSLVSLLQEYPSGVVLEELIMQEEEIGRLHPESVNTLRVHTVITKNGEKVLHPYIRMGRGNNVVDNAGKGGIFTKLDESTGVVVAAVDEFCHSFSIHPDSGMPLIGYQIPKFKEAIDLSKELALVVPDAKYVGWDLALTSKGWAMIEGNTRAQFVFQIPKQEGFRKEFEIIKKEVLV